LRVISLHATVRDMLHNEHRTEFHLVDPENLLAGPRFIAKDVTALRARYTDVSTLAATAQVVLGTSAEAPMLESGLGWCGTRRVWLPGAGGADRALLRIVREENLAARFTRVVIGSGAGVFAEAAAALQAQGCHVTVVCRADSLSRRLRLAVLDVRFLEPIICADVMAARGVA
jgi:hypothetical protein